MVLLAHQILTTPSTINLQCLLSHQQLALQFLVLYHLLPPHKELCFERERKTNGHVQLQKPGASLNSKFQKSS